jgi:hypothetical protein
MSFSRLVSVKNGGNYIRSKYEVLSVSDNPDLSLIKPKPGYCRKRTSLKAVGKNRFDLVTLDVSVDLPTKEKP